MLKFGLWLRDTFSAELGWQENCQGQKKATSPWCLTPKQVLLLTLNMYTRHANMMNRILKTSNIQKQIILCCSPTSCFGRINLGILGKDDVQFLHQFDLAWPLYCQLRNVKDSNEHLYVGKITWLWGRMPEWSKKKKIKYLKHFTMKSPSPPSPNPHVKSGRKVW